MWVLNGFWRFRRFQVLRGPKVFGGRGAEVMRGQGLAILGLRLAAGGTVRRVCAYGKKNTWQMSIQRLAHMFRLTWCVLARCLFLFCFVWRRGCRCPADGRLERHRCHATSLRCSAPLRLRLYLLLARFGVSVGTVWSYAGTSAAVASLLFERQQLDCCATDTPAKLEDFVGLVKVVQQARWKRWCTVTSWCL